MHEKFRKEGDDMSPRLFMLIAFVIISLKVFHMIYLSLFRAGLCDDGFYCGGIAETVSGNKMKQRKTAPQTRSANRKALRKRPSASSGKNLNTGSYSTYKKLNSL